MTQPRRPSPPRRGVAPGGGPAPTPREQVLARRRMALLALGAAVPITLILAIVMNSVPLLVVNIVAGLVLAGFVAMLLQIKQAQQRGASQPAARSRVDDEDVRVGPPQR